MIAPEIQRYADVEHGAGLQQEIDEIFYEASSVTSFDSAAAREAFHWLWLGRYLAEEPEHTFLAMTPEGRACGYLVGSLADPAARKELAELGYFREFAPLTAAYPAHLHINIAADWRSHGIGAALIAAFVAHARAHGIGGVHVVTGQGMRNVGFYTRLGFVECGAAGWRGGTVVLLGLDIR